MVPFATPLLPMRAPDALEAIRERLFTTMWDDAGIVRDAAGLERGRQPAGSLDEALDRYRLPTVARDPSFNMTWHDWINL